MNKKLLLIFLCIGSFAEVRAHASFSGTWAGDGKAWDSNGWKASCKHVASQITQTKGELLLVGGGWKCGQLNSQWTQARIEIREGGLWLHGIQVGTIDARTLSAEIPNGPVRSSYRAELLPDGTLRYEERVIDGKDLFVLKSTLKKTRHT